MRSSISIAIVISAALTAACTTTGDEGNNGDDDVTTCAHPNGTCDIDQGETVANCPADCSDDDVPTAESASWPCRGGKDQGGDYFECKPSYMDAPAAGEVPNWVGHCHSEGVDNYWSGPKEPAQVHANGWWRLYLQGDATECDLTVAQCADRTNPHCWDQFGLGSITIDSLAGPYRWCGGPNQDCVMKLKRNPGHRPTALGN